MKKYSYEIVLRSKKLDISLPDIPREFRRAEPGGAIYSKEIINERFETDNDAMSFARKESKKRDKDLVQVTKMLYRNWKKN